MKKFCAHNVWHFTMPKDLSKFTTLWIWYFDVQCIFHDGENEPFAGREDTILRWGSSQQVTPHNLHKLLRRVVRLRAIICARIRTPSARPFRGNSGITWHAVLFNYYPVAASSRLDLLLARSLVGCICVSPGSSRGGVSSRLKIMRHSPWKHRGNSTIADSSAAASSWPKFQVWKIQKTAI